MKRPDKRNEYPHHSDVQTTAQDIDLDLVSDPRMDPPQVALFDANNPDCWIQTDEELLINLVSVR